MRKFTIKAFALAAALFMTQGMMAQQDNIVFQETFYDGLGEFTPDGYTGSYAGNIWTWIDYSHMAKAEINNNLANYEKTPNPVCLLKSPNIELGNETYVATFDQANVWMTDGEKEVTFVIREVGTEEWQALSAPLMKYGNWPLSSVGVIEIPETYKNKTVEFAFKFMPIVEDFTNAGNWYVKDFVVWVGSATDKIDAKLSFDETSYEVLFDDGFMSPAVNNPNEVEVSYSSSNPYVATVDEVTGEVTLLNNGETTITATSVENEYFLSSTASYTLNVIKEIEYVDLFTETFENGLGEFTVEGFNGPNDNIWTDGGGFANADAYGKMEEKFSNYLVSSAFKLDGVDCIATFDYLAQYFAEDMVASQMVFAIREVGGNWEEVTIPTCQNSPSFINSGKIEIPESYNGKDIQVAFKYTAENSINAGNWQIKNLVVKAPVVPTAIEGVDTENNVTSKVFDLQGREIKNPAKGIYIINGKKVVVK